MQGIDNFLRFCINRGAVTLANGARFVFRGAEGQKAYMEQTNLPTANGGGNTDWYTLGQTSGVYSMYSNTPNLLVVDSDHNALSDLRTEYESIIADTYIPSPANQSEMDANLVAFNKLRVALGLSPVS